MRRSAAALVAVLALGAGCGDGDGEGRSGTPLRVSAAASLKPAFEAYGRAAGEPAPRFSFAGSDELAAQIRQGAASDVYAAASTELPQQLFEEGLVEKPVVVAGNRLVVAVPRESPVRSLGDLEEPGLKLIVGNADVPVGAYTREVLARLPERSEQAILGNVRSEESDVIGLTGKLARGAGDAGFLYATDVVAAGGELRLVELPERLQPEVRYGAAIVRGSGRRARARRFVQGLLEGPGRAALRSAGFTTP